MAKEQPSVKVEVSGITIDLPEGQYLLTLEQARELYESLRKLFGEPAVSLAQITPTDLCQVTNLPWKITPEITWSSSTGEPPNAPPTVYSEAKGSSNA